MPHLLVERLAVVLLRLGADVAAGGGHVAVLANVVDGDRPAESRNIAIRGDNPLWLPWIRTGTGACPYSSTPGAVGVGDPLDVVVGQFAVGAVHHAAQLAGIDEEHLAAAVP
ncbi:MAG: hypothetical protein NNA20_13350 [Nitrospira sp.]|nr:hypothetical protein [Nitrospira sp.]